MAERGILPGGYLLTGGAAAPEKDGDCGEDTLKQRVRRAEREAILKALVKTGGNKAKAARLLNMSRSRLYLKMEGLGIKD
ncbi:MAG: helix-turn-helix domain-containing protein [Bacillota bacterium]